MNTGAERKYCCCFVLVAAIVREGRVVVSANRRIQGKPLRIPICNPWKIEAQKTVNKLEHVLRQGHTTCARYMREGNSFGTPLVQ
jgi:hypothetical protein